ncbi:arf-GAP with Rho-GAP domain, ANK repeat and PH domain-containing protein 1-like, partial [Mustelus asterias]
MAEKDSACQTPCSDVTDTERSSTGESPSSFFSDEDNVDDYEMMLGITPGSNSDDLSLVGLRVDTELHCEDNLYSHLDDSLITSSPAPKHGVDTSQLCPIIKAGWLDKNPPQGSYIYQRRFVKLDPDYLRYFENDKEVYSKRVISVKSITQVSSVGDQKFEVITSNRTFVFRAESDGETDNWVRVIQQTVEEKRETDAVPTARVSDYFLRDSVLQTGPKSGYLEIRTSRHKIYVSIRGDKVWLYKNEE